VYTHHKFDHAFPPGVETQVSYMVCALPRSGSSLLCELLCNTEHAGAPTEFFDRETMERFQRAWGVDSFDAYVAALLAKKTSPNGVFGFKVHWEQFADTLVELDVLALFPNLRFVHIDRTDRVRQAVSFARALQTNQWASDHPVRNDRPMFDRAQIDDCLRRIRRGEEMWGRFFEQNRISPLRVVYADLVARPQPTLLGVLRHLGVTGSTNLASPPPTLKKQADALSDEWVRRYRSSGDDPA
jgi:LPS sulfotransferase NodH